MTRAHRIALAALCLALAAIAARAEEVAVAMTPERLTVTGVPAGTAPDALAVTRAGRPIAGTAQWRGRVLDFTPRFAFLPGARYTVALPGGGVRTAALPAPDGPAPAVTALTPAAARLPANLLRLRLHFSRPMARGHAADFVRLETAAGERLAGAFRATRRELWDPAGTRLTLLLDPARVKTGLGAHRRLGRPLTPGGRYRLVVAAGWPDRHGRVTAHSFVHDFTAAPAIVERLTPADWRIAGPRPGRATPVTIRFDRPLDPLLAGRFLQLRRDGRPVPGRTVATPDGRAWRFHPAAPWPDGPVTLHLHPQLEDAAGNRLSAAFDHAGATKRGPRGAQTLRIPPER